jgi:DNA-directed RNA polymerase subunit beta
MRGSWIDLEFDPKDILHVRIDRRRKFPATLLAQGLGMDAQQLLDMMYPTEVFHLDEEKLFVKVSSPKCAHGPGDEAAISRTPRPARPWCARAKR